MSTHAEQTTAYFGSLLINDLAHYAWQYSLMVCPRMFILFDA